MARRAPQRPPAVRGPVVAFIAVLLLAAAAVAAAVAPLAAPATPHWWALPWLLVLLIGATWFVVPYRYGRSIDAVNLVEATLAPLLIAFPPLAVVAVVVVSQVVNGALRRLAPVKTAFNTASWALAAGLGAAVVAALGDGPAWPHRTLALLVALAVVGAVNVAAIAVVVALAEGERLRHLGPRLAPVVQLGWLGGWSVNAAMGLLFALAYLATPAAVVLFAAPLLVLHLAYRSYSMARADQARLVAAHRAAARLAEPLQPLAAVPAFLADLAACFDAAAVELVVRSEGGRDIHRFARDGEGYGVRSEGDDIASLEGLLSASPTSVRGSAGDDDAVSRALAAAGRDDCLAAPLLDGDRIVGVVAVFDRGGFEGSDSGELAVLEAVARETTRALGKGRLLADVLEERRKLAEIVGRASDGICTFGDEGVVLSWNPALERITGLAAAQVIGRRGVVGALRVRTIDGTPLRCEGSISGDLPGEIRITAVDGTVRHLTCSYSRRAADADGDGPALVVVARDVTPLEEHEALREKFSRLVEADAARRAVVEQLQQAVVPAPLTVPGAQLAAAYEASDPSAPTGGDLYDWQVLPGGEIHVAVVDVLGHGVAATKDALAVIHTLRVVSASGAPLDEVVARADDLLGAQNPDLVATVIIARYEPESGRLRVVSGGHPPALVVTARGQVGQLAASGGAIGWPGAGSDNLAEAVLEPGDALVLYTDGLIEARKNILDGMEALVRHAEEVAQLPAPALARELLARALSGADRRDDTLALVLRRDPVPATAAAASWEAAPEVSEVSRVRRTLQEWLRDHAEDEGDAALVAAELLANAARSGRASVVLRAELTADHLVIDVTDDGNAPADLAHRGNTLPDDDDEGGRGLWLVRALSERMDVLTTAEGSTVRAVLPRPRPGTGAVPGMPDGARARGRHAGRDPLDVATRNEQG